MGDEPESSSQALERFLSAQLAELSITVPSDDVGTTSTPTALPLICYRSNIWLVSLKRTV